LWTPHNGPNVVSDGTSRERAGSPTRPRCATERAAS
jgi:hypothetical protein